MKRFLVAACLVILAGCASKPKTLAFHKHYEMLRVGQYFPVRALYTGDYPEGHIRLEVYLNTELQAVHEVESLPSRVITFTMVVTEDMWMRAYYGMMAEDTNDFEGFFMGLQQDEIDDWDGDFRLQLEMWETEPHPEGPHKESLKVRLLGKNTMKLKVSCPQCLTGTSRLGADAFRARESGTLPR